MPDPAADDGTVGRADDADNLGRADDADNLGRADYADNLGRADYADTVVVVRVYNEAPVVAGVLRELREAGFLVIAVDDGSSDASADEIDAVGAFRVSHSVNIGAGGALQTGVEAALRFTSASYIACFDADGQHRLVDLVGMVGKIREGYDVVIGSRFLDGNPDMGLLRRSMLKLAARLVRRGDGFRLTDAHNGLRIVTR
ncbi:MAG: glycosyltransferase family 2 protein, partial [Geodermatophilaceae bacterium]|nr:glycosyltransferase family 2 protein [Geodermatophilaceae bacterium]